MGWAVGEMFSRRDMGRACTKEVIGTSYANLRVLCPVLVMEPATQLVDLDFYS